MKPFFRHYLGPRTNNDQNDVIQGSVQVDPSGGYVHTFGAPRKQSAPQTPSTAPIQNYQNSPYQDSVTVTSTPRYTQQIIIPTNDVSSQFKSPARQTSYQSNSSQFSPVQQSPQRSGQASPSFYQPQNNGFDNRVDSNSSTMIIHPARKVSSNYQPVRQDSSPYQTNRQDSMPYQVNRQDSMPYQVNRQESTPYQAERRSPSPYQQSSWSNPPARQESASYQPSRQDSWNQSAQQNSISPSRQTSNTYPPSRQDSWSNQPVHQNSSNSVFNRQESFSNKPNEANSSHFPPVRQDSWSQNLPQPTGLFGGQNTSPTTNQQAVRYEPVNSNSTPGFQRQPSTNYQSLPKPYSPASSNSSVNQQQPQFNNGNSPYTYGVPGPFVRQQSQQSSGNQPWSPAPVESFPTPPPFSPSVESSGAPWPSSSELPTPPPPPPPPPPPSQSQQTYPTPPQSQQAPPTLQSQQMPPPPPTSAPPPPPTAPTSTPTHAVFCRCQSRSAGLEKKQIKATKEAKAAAGIPSQTPGTPSSGGPELPAALAGSMKKDKKPFTYLPGGLDLSEIRSPKMQKRIIANQQHAPPPPSCTGQQVLLQPRTNGANQLPNQFDRLNLGEQQNSDRMATAVEPQRRTSTDGQDTRYPGQSRSFRILQMMTGGDDETDNRYQNEGPQEQQNEEGPVDIRYKGGYIPGRSFKMLQEMTSMNEDGTPMGPPVPSVLQEKRQQRKPPPHLHLNINNQPPPPKQFPQPQVPASQQQTEEVPKMYTGGRIPSKSFRILEAMTGANDGEHGTDM
ncbi:hypothetical protein HNY73_003475 [Argiope bruennichi]|uniref:Uncharacterized protein n=1 Tax=Argiope bruennichi TaxID=94029 RepID=A0A8T0FN54_ARGBR|nr:hypothetical protein HNY73_003475 [Argiope bruennichi]